jgi:AraC-like DNA-binding protein
MDENPGGRLSLSTMGQLVGLSPSRLRHKFKSEVGSTPTLYLQQLRLRTARELLKRDGLSVKQVRAAIGIESGSYFTHRFKRAYGVTPSKSRSISHGHELAPENTSLSPLTHPIRLIEQPDGSASSQIEQSQPDRATSSQIEQEKSLA